MSRKKGGKHHQKHRQQNITLGTEETVASYTATVDASTHHCEGIHNENKEKEEPTQLSRKWGWDLMSVLTAVLALGTILTFRVLFVQLQDARNNFAQEQRPYVWIANGPGNAVFYSTQVGQPARVLVKYSNFGHSPAIITKIGFSTEIGKGVTDVTLQAPDMREFPSVLPSGKDDFIDSYSKEVVTADNLASILNDGGITFLAIIRYHDAAMHEFESDVCILRSAGNVQLYCPTFNRIRECEKQKCIDTK